MIPSPIQICLPIADRRRSHDFYRSALDLEAVGAPAEDGMPEPLTFALNEHAQLMLIPSGGFGWVIGDHEVAAPGTSECLLSVSVPSEAEVGELLDRAREAGASITVEPAAQPWGYTGTFADPDGHLWTVTRTG